MMNPEGVSSPAHIHNRSVKERGKQLSSFSAAASWGSAALPQEAAADHPDAKKDAGAADFKLALEETPAAASGRLC